MAELITIRVSAEEQWALEQLRSLPGHSNITFFKDKAGMIARCERLVSNVCPLQFNYPQGSRAQD